MPNCLRASKARHRVHSTGKHVKIVTQSYPNRDATHLLLNLCLPFPTATLTLRQYAMYPSCDRCTPHLSNKFLLHPCVNELRGGFQKPPLCRQNCTVGVCWNAAFRQLLHCTIDSLCSAAAGNERSWLTKITGTWSESRWTRSEIREAISEGWSWWVERKSFSPIWR